MSADNKNKDNKEKGGGWLKSLFSPNNVSSLFKGLGSGVTGIISSAINYGFQKRLADQTFAHQQAENEQVFQQNRLLAQEQNQFNLDQWNRENAYNSPSAQMARYHAAGLNPDLIYGHNNVAANSPTLVAGTPKSPSNYAESRASAVSAALSLQNVFAQNSLLKAQKENIEADTDNKKADTGGKDLDNKFKADSYAMRLLGIDLGNQTAEQYIETLKSEANKNNTSAAESLKRIEQISAEIQKIDAEIGKIASECANIDADTQKKILESKELEVLIEKHAAEIHNINAQTALYQEKKITEGAIRSQLYASAQMLMSQADLNSQAYLQNETLFPIKVQQEEKQLEIQDASKRSIDATADLTKKQEQTYDKYKTWENINGSINAGSNFLNALGNLIQGSKKGSAGKVLGKVLKKK